MRRISAWLLVMVLLLTALGCAADAPGGAAGSAGTTSVPATAAPVEETKMPEVPVAPVTPEMPPAPAEPPAEPTPERVTYTVERDVLEKTVYAADGTRLAELRYRLPLLQAIGEDGAVIAQGTTDVRTRALEVTAAFNAHFDAWRQDNETLKLYAEGDYQQNPGIFSMGMSYADELDFSVWQTEQLVSIEGDSYSYYGGAHPNTVLLAWNFDLLSGTYINALSIGHDQQEFRAVVAEELIRQAEERARALEQEPMAMYWEDYRTILGNWSEYPVSFDGEGMTVRFSPYELGSYAAGSHEFTIGYDFLDPHLGDYGRKLLGLTATPVS